MAFLPLPDRLTRIEDELALMDSTLDAKVLHLQQEIRRLDVEIIELRTRTSMRSTNAK